MSTAPTTAPTSQAKGTSDSRSNWLVLAVLLIGMFMALLDTTIVNVALPTIATNLNASEATLSWIISGYALAFGLALIPAGRIGDRFGHKWVFITGLAIFTIASLACGLAADGTQLVIARVVQGLGGGIFLPAVTAFIQLLFKAQQRGRAFAVLGAVTGVASALGPIVGGLIIEALGETTGWRWVFAVNLPIGLIALVAAAILLPAIAEGKKASTDVVGLLLVTGALVAILVPLIQGQDEGWPLWTFLSLVGGMVLLVVFAFWERRVAARGTCPLVPPHLFQHRAFTGGAILALVFFASFTSIFFTISLLWQTGLGYSALESGLVSVPFAVGSVVGAAFSNRLAEKLGRGALMIGNALLSIGLIALFVIVLVVPTSDLTSWELLGPLLVAGFGSGLFIAPNARFIVATVDRAESGAASSVLNTMQRIGAAVGVAVIGSVLFANTTGASAGTDLATAFGQGSAAALAVSAGLAIAAFALSFTLPKRVDAA